MDDNVQKRIDALEQNEKKKKSIVRFVVIFLIVIFFAGLGWGVNEVLLTEGTQDPYAVTATVPLEIDTDSSTVISTLDKCLNDAAKPDSVKFKVETNVDIPDDSIKVESGDNTILEELKYMKDDLLERVKEHYEKYESTFGEDFLSKVNPLDFDLQCIGEVSQTRGRLNDDNELNDYETYFYSAQLLPEALYAPESTASRDSIGLDTFESIKKSCLESIETVASDVNLELTAKDFAVSFQTNVETGRIKSVTYKRGYAAVLTLTFKGALEKIGTQTISFDFYANENHEYTWAALTLSAHTLWLEKGDVDNLEANRTTDEIVGVTWESSNPEIATVDEEGYIKGKKISEESVIITATIEYLGNTYTDSCEVYVRKPIDEIKHVEKELTLSTGESTVLEVTVKPKKATIKTLLWFSEDESIATVDESGKVTAIGVGDTKVYAISLDGNYKASTSITVKGGTDNG